jgi:AraC family transcriptional regulator, transcriptional activator FtrA
VAALQLAILTIIDQIMPKQKKVTSKFNPLVVALSYEGLCTFEYACAAEIFGLPRPEMGPNWYRFETCAIERRTVRAQYGLQIKAQHGLERLADAGTIIVPGWKGMDVPVPSRVLNALRDAHARGARLLSICSGSFVLAATGLLDGKRATTHWRYAEALKHRFPLIDVDPDVLYVDEGQLLTSAGSAAGLDLCLHLIRRDHGPSVANQVARRLVIPPHRDGGQSQYIERPVQSERNSLSALLDKMRKRIDRPWTIPELASMAAMSERTFMRRFKEVTGMTCTDWLVQMRVDMARELLEQSNASIDAIAQKSGFGSAITMRHHFQRKLGTNPRAYRARFSGSAVAQR